MVVAVDCGQVPLTDGWHEMKVGRAAPLGPATRTDRRSGRTFLAWGTAAICAGLEGAAPAAGAPAAVAACAPTPTRGGRRPAARLTVVEGDATDAEAAEAVVRGADAVISVIGQTKGSPPDLQTTAARTIVAAMQRHGVQRLVSLTGAGVDAPQDRPTLLNHAIKLALKTVSGPALRDALGHVAIIGSSGLEWTIVRVPRLTDGPRVGRYRVGWVGVNTGTRIARADVADFLLE